MALSGDGARVAGRAQVIADELGRWSRGGASAERMYRTLTDPKYQKATNKHGRRINPRKGVAMHVMAEWALRKLPGYFLGRRVHFLVNEFLCFRPTRVSRDARNALSPCLDFWWAMLPCRRGGQPESDCGGDRGQ
jgi:hypothetical protein